MIAPVRLSRDAPRCVELRESAACRSRALIALVAAGFARPVAAQENPYTTALDQLLGQQTFLAQCARCHGLNARGNPESAAPDLTGPLDANTDAELFAVIREGMPGTAMPAIGQRASDQMVWQLVTYLNSFGVDPSQYELGG